MCPLDALIYLPSRCWMLERSCRTYTGGDQWPYRLHCRIARTECKVPGDRQLFMVASIPMRDTWSRLSHHHGVSAEVQVVKRELLDTYVGPIGLSLALIVLSVAVGEIKPLTMTVALLLLVGTTAGVFAGSVVVGLYQSSRAQGQLETSVTSTSERMTKAVEELEGNLTRLSIDSRLQLFNMLSSISMEKLYLDERNAGLLSEREVFALESTASEVWVWAYDYRNDNWDQRFSAAVRENLSKGIPYRYIVPDRPEVRNRVINLLERYINNEFIGLSRIPVFKVESDQPRYIQMGITIYNPSLQDGSRDLEGSVAVFFPHYRDYAGAFGAAPFLSMKGASTAEIQEAFLARWRDAKSIDL